LKVVDPILKRHFRHEFLNRLDEVLPFIPLQEKDMEAIVTLQLHRVRQRLQEKNIQLYWLPAAVTHLAQKGYDPLYGARPLKRLIQSEIVNLLSSAILEGKIAPQQTISLDVGAEDRIRWK